MTATIVIPTFNAGGRFREVVASLVRQASPQDILVIDSGSTDATCSIVSEFGLRLHQIPNREFGHGRSRNLAAGLCTSDYIVFLTQDARPLDDWLEHLLQPFTISQHVAASFGAQHPPPGTRAPVRRELLDVCTRLGPPDGIVLHGKELSTANPSWASKFFTNVTSAVRRDVLEKVPFRDVSYAEDQALAADLHREGYLTAYAPLARVEHAHDYPLFQYFTRTYDDVVGLRQATGRLAKRGLIRHLGTALVLSARDIRVAMSGPEDFTQRVRWAASAPAYEAFRRVAIALGTTDVSRRTHNWLSREARLRRGQ